AGLAEGAGGAPARRTGLLRPIATGGIMGLAIGASLRNSTKEPSRDGGFRAHAEGFFGANTYAGGADKAAHFVHYTIAWRLMDTAYRGIGYTDSQSRWLAAGPSVAAGACHGNRRWNYDVRVLLRRPADGRSRRRNLDGPVALRLGRHIRVSLRLRRAPGIGLLRQRHLRPGILRRDLHGGLQDRRARAS